MRIFRHPLFIVLAILATSLYLRANQLEHGAGFHPDERHIIMTLEKMSWEKLSPGFFAYGSLPFYIAFFSSRILEAITPWPMHYDNLFMLGRAISVLFGVLSVLLTGLVAFQVFRNRAIAISAALLLSFNVLHIQLSRFFAFDVILAGLCTATLSAALLIMRRNFRAGVPLTALFLGLALATKISALSLLVPISFSLASAHDFQWRRIPRAALQLLMIALGGVIVFALAEPFAFVEWPLFTSQNLEQINMTRGTWRPPYTIQYWNTTPWLYALEQMARWTFWWPAFIAALAGMVIAPLVKTSDSAREKWLLLIWIGISFFSIAGLQVKFPRYLLPIYPALCIFAAWAFEHGARLLSDRLPRHQRQLGYRTLLCATLLPSALFAYAFRGIYNQPHSYESASHWIYQNVPPGSAIVGFHWDDKIPLTLPGFEPRAYGYKVDTYELPIYELPDSSHKLALLTQTLEKADFLAWPTSRINGSLPRVPDEYPRSLKMLELLYSGKIGFELVHSDKVRPHLGAFEWRSDALDESLSVYDHPKVMIFKKTEQLAADELATRIESALEASPMLPSRDELLERDFRAGSTQQNFTRTDDSQLLPILAWFAIIEALAFFTWPVLALIFRHSPDRGYLLSKSAGVLFFGLLGWFLMLGGAIQLSRSGLLLIFAMMGVAGAIALAREKHLRYQLNDILQQRGFTVEVLLLVTTLVLMIIKSFQPEIFWGEKPMDFGMLNYFLRLEALPPQDPWAAGYQFQYYYLGTFIISLLVKLSGVSAGIGFNLGMVLVSTLTVTGACAVLSHFTRRLWLAVAAAVVFFLASNFEVLRLWLDDRIHTFDLFWASSRILHPPAFAEYPLWSFLFGDLHAHVIAYPFTLLLAGAGIALAREWFLDERSTNLPGAALYGVILGSLFALNAWDCISYSLFSVMLFGVGFIPNQKHISWMTGGERLRTIMFRAATAVAAMLIVVIPYSRTATSRVQTHWGSVYREEFNFLHELLLFHGHWYLLVLLSTLAISSLFAYRARRQISPLRLVGLGLLTLLPVILTGLAQLDGADGTPWPAISISCTLILFSGSLLIFPQRRPEAIFLALCGITAGIILAGTETFFLFDRMNTIFKFYGTLGTLLSLGALGGTLYFIEEIEELPFRFQYRWVWAAPVLAVTVVVLIFLGAASGINIHAMTTYRRIEPVVRPTLDGSAFLSRYAPDEAALFRWIKSSIKGTPVLLEAHGQSYANYTRVQMNTGLPVLAGWEHHVRQRGVDHRDYQRRVSAIARMFGTTDLDDAKKLMSQNGIELIVIGELERKTYAAAGLDKFSHPDSGFYKLFEQGKVALYAPPGSRYHPDFQRMLRTLPQ